MHKYRPGQYSPPDSSNLVVLRVPVTMSPSSPKMLLVFCDGTGADGTLTGTEIHAPRQFATNVLRLSRAVLQTSTDNQKRQIVLYLSGVGSESDFNGDFVAVAPLLQASGVAVASKIRDAYAFIAQNFEVGDEICIFGFSRGVAFVLSAADN